MLTSVIQKDLLDFIKYDKDDRKGLIQFWYMANSNALSASLTQTDSLKLMLNLSDFSHFEHLSKKLFLMSDTIILRDNRHLTENEGRPDCIPFIKDYKPSFWDDYKDQISQLTPSPFTLQYNPSAFWTSTSKKLNNGLIAGYAFDITNIPIPEEFIEWISNDGHKYLSTGNIIYAPFIPPIEFEMELLRNKVSLPDTYQAVSLFCEQNTFLQSSAITALLSLRIPAIENIDIQTIKRIKEDNYDSYNEFSVSIMNALINIKSIEGTANFKNEVAYIQRNLIDDSTDKVIQSTKLLKSSTVLRRMGFAINVLGITASLFSPEYSTVGALSGLTPGLIEMITDLKRRSIIKETKSSFLLELQQNTKL